MLALTISLFLTVAHATSGGTDSDGCHTDSSTNSYHCHNEGSGTTQGSQGSQTPLNRGERILLISVMAIGGGLLYWKLRKDQNLQLSPLFHKKRNWNLDSNEV